MFPDFTKMADDIKSAAADLRAGHAASQTTLESIERGIASLVTEARAQTALLRTIVNKECYAHGRRND